MEKKIYCWHCAKELNGLDHYESEDGQYHYCEDCADEKLIETEYGLTDEEIDGDMLLDDDLSDIDMFHKVKGGKDEN